MPTTPKALRNLNPNLCFICQVNAPEFSIRIKPKVKIKVVNVCEPCKDLLNQEQESLNRIKRAIFNEEFNSNFRLFTEVLGMNLMPAKIVFKKLETK